MSYSKPMTAADIADLDQWAHAEAAKGITMIGAWPWRLTFYPAHGETDARYEVTKADEVLSTHRSATDAVRAFEEHAWMAMA